MLSVAPLMRLCGWLFGAFVSYLFPLYADKNSDFHHPNQHRMILDEHGEVVPLD